MTLSTKHAASYIRILLDKTRDNHSLALTIFKKLFEELPEQIDAIKNALDSQQYSVAQQITHKLHGSASFCGLNDIQEPASALESNLLNHDYESANRHFQVLRRCVLNFTSHRTTIIAELVDNSGQ
ncbi:Hpt domain-containing protein [Methylobacter sp. YRD-M1]|uniref:Hpt domain-containing protein n=1 Tax=Methylobacter sp. YRD-M1 TaxID=2911520 RepID=UPI00227B475E|nr:Hpt domain-containing protein [Methylobacter sp. YRD-M1]WAK02988.1 Hpt domain-containing protein [Methylobacter sp. YRD-M1]